jgi:hypothetical protein
LQRRHMDRSAGGSGSIGATLTLSNWFIGSLAHWFIRHRLSQ